MTTRIAYLMTSLFVLALTVNLPAQDAPTAASLYNDGLAKAKAKKYAEALTLMEQAIEAADPEADAKVVQLAKKNGARAAYGVGYRKRKAKDYDAAIEAYRKGSEMNPNYVGNFKGLAQSLEDKGNIVEAIPAYIEAAQVAEKGTKTKEDAVELYGKAENIVAVTYGKKEWDNVIAYSNAFLELRETADVHYYLANALAAKGDQATAKTHIDKAIELAEGDKSKYFFTKGEIHEKLGETADAVSAYKAVTASDYKKRADYQVGKLEGGK